MRPRYPALLTALLTAAAASLAAAQQAAPDNTHQARAIAHAQQTIASDTARLHRDIAMRDSARATLDRDHRHTQAESAQIDSLKARIDRDRKAGPRDSAVVNRELAALTRDRQRLDHDLDRDRQEASREKTIEARVRKESDAAIDAHHALGRDRSKPSASKSAPSH